MLALAMYSSCRVRCTLLYTHFCIVAEHQLVDDRKQVSWLLVTERGVALP